MLFSRRRKQEMDEKRNSATSFEYHQGIIYLPQLVDIFAHEKNLATLRKSDASWQSTCAPVSESSYRYIDSRNSVSQNFNLRANRWTAGRTKLLMNGRTIEMRKGMVKIMIPASGCLKWDCRDRGRGLCAAKGSPWIRTGWCPSINALTHYPTGSGKVTAHDRSW